MRHLGAPVLFALCFAFAASGCSFLEEATSPPDVRSIEEVMGTAVPLAYVATVAKAAFDGEDVDCVSFAVDCADPPCTGVVNIEVSPACPLPLVPNASGQITVVAMGAATEIALMSAVFSEVDVGARKLMIRSVDSFIVSRDGSELRVAYVDQDVRLSSPRNVEVQQSEWVILVNTADTPGDAADDRLTLHGGRQQVEGARVVQTALAQVVMDSSCRRNPLDGVATIEITDGDRPGASEVTTLTFHPSCDGRADVLVSVGTSVASSGRSIALDFTD